MGALCGKEDHFDALERHGKGQKLGAAAPPASSSNAPTSTAAGSSAGGAAAGPPRSISTSPPQRLGGTADASGGGGTGDSAARREAMLAAAENRANKVRLGSCAFSLTVANAETPYRDSHTVGGAGDQERRWQVDAATRTASQGRRTGRGSAARRREERRRAARGMSDADTAGPLS